VHLKAPTFAPNCEILEIISVQEFVDVICERFEVGLRASMTIQALAIAADEFVERFN
jgi:hypothetical protein